MKHIRGLALLLAACLLMTLCPVALAEEDAVAAPFEAMVDELECQLGEDSLPEESEAVDLPLLAGEEAVVDDPAPVDPEPEEPAPEEPEPIPTFELLKNQSHKVNIGEVFQITLGGKTAKKFVSSAKAIAAVDETGLVTPKAAGTAKITATLSKTKQLVLTLKVVDPTMPTSIKLFNEEGTQLTSKSTVKVDLQGTKSITVVLAPDTAISDIRWKSSKDAIASVILNEEEQRYEVVGKKEGTVTITAVTRNSKKATFNVKVVDPHKPTGIKLFKLDETPLTSKTTVKVSMYEPLPVAVALAPETAISDIAWKSSKSSIASVILNEEEQRYEVVGKKEGTVTITASTWNKKTASFKVKVFDPFKPTGIKLYNADGAQLTAKTTVKVSTLEPLSVSFALAPEDARSEITWKSSKASIASVEDGVITGHKEGTVTITASTYNGKTASFKVKIFDPLKATSVSLDRTGTVSLPLKQTLQLAAITVPENTSSTLKWTTSDKKIAKVSQEGVVTPVKKGTATITVTTSSGKSAKVKVKVVAEEKPAVDIFGQWPFSDLDNVVELGDTYETAVTLDPVNACSKVTWTSSNEDVAVIQSAERDKSYWHQVVIKPLFPGETRITATTDNGLTASFKLTVITRILPESIAFEQAGPVSAKAGDRLTLRYAVLPGASIGRVENCATIISSDPAVAEVTSYKNDNGRMDCSGAMDFDIHIAAKAAGTAKITITLANGVTGSIDVVVQ